MPLCPSILPPPPPSFPPHSLPTRTSPIIQWQKPFFFFFSIKLSPQSQSPQSQWSLYTGCPPVRASNARNPWIGEGAPRCSDGGDERENSFWDQSRTEIQQMAAREHIPDWTVNPGVWRRRGWRGVLWVWSSVMRRDSSVWFRFKSFIFKAKQKVSMDTLMDIWDGVVELHGFLCAWTFKMFSKTHRRTGAVLAPW